MHNYEHQKSQTSRHESSHRMTPKQTSAMAHIPDLQISRYSGENETLEK